MTDEPEIAAVPSNDDAPYVRHEPVSDEEFEQWVKRSSEETDVLLAEWDTGVAFEQAITQPGPVEELRIDADFEGEDFAQELEGQLEDPTHLRYRPPPPPGFESWQAMRRHIEEGGTLLSPGPMPERIAQRIREHIDSEHGGDASACPVPSILGGSTGPNWQGMVDHIIENPGEHHIVLGAPPGMHHSEALRLAHEMGEQLRREVLAEKARRDARASLEAAGVVIVEEGAHRSIFEELGGVVPRDRLVDRVRRDLGLGAL